MNPSGSSTINRRSLLTAMMGAGSKAAFGGTTAEITLEESRTEIRIARRGIPVTAFVFDSKYDKPFLYPLRTASGRIISRGFPIAPRPGDSDDHAWHRGIWYGHGSINGHDFWRELGRDKTGRVVVKSVPSHGDRPGTITSSLELQPATGDAIGALEEQFAFAAGEREVTIDASITILADCGVALRMGDTEDGGFGIRLREEFRQDRGAVLMNAEGARGTENIWGKPSRWVCYSASVEGAPASVVMMDHPANLRYPTRWHARGYGLCSANPFALRDFTGEARADGSHTIPAGGRLQLRYRVVIHEGEALGVAEAERMHRAFAS